MLDNWFDEGTDGYNQSVQPAYWSSLPFPLVPRNHWPKFASFLTKRHTLYIALYSSFYISDLFLTITKYRGHLRSYVVYHGFLLNVMPVVVQKLMPLMMERLNIIIKTKIDEHLRPGLQHWRGNGSGKSPYDGSCFKVMDTGSSSFKLKVKEDLHIN